MKFGMYPLVALALVGTAHATSLEEGIALKRAEKLAEAEAVFADVVRAEPDNAAALAEWATVLGWLGRFDDSIAAWRRALELEPGDPAAGVALARVEYWKGDLGAARAGIEGVIAAAPDNADALALGGDICAAAGDLGCARADYVRAQALAPSAELERKLAGAADPPRLRFDAGGTLDSYDTRGGEGSFFVQASWQASAPLVVSTGYEQLHQFGRVDHRLNLGASVHPIAPLVLGARFAASPTADTIARWEASGGAELRVAGPVTGLMTVRHLDFANNGVTIFGAGARLDLGRWSLIGQGGFAVSTVNPTEGYGAGRAELGLDPVRIYVGFSRGVEAQLLLAPATATDVTAGVLWQIDARFGLRLDYVHETYGDAYVRNSVGTALTVKL